MAYLQFLGAAGTVTGSKHLINAAVDGAGQQGFQVLIDCGLFQGQKEWRERNWQDTPIPAREIDAVIVTHAHLDHSGWIPRLVKEGFRGAIYATPATVELCGILLPDSGHLQEEDAEHHNWKKSSKHSPALPLYTFDEAKACLKYFRPVEFSVEQQLRPGFNFRFVRSGHILGASMVEATVGADGRKTRLLFTGDLGRVRDNHIAPGKVIHYGPAQGEAADVLVMESTYGNRLHPHTDVRPELATLVRQALQRGGSVIVPAFAVERTQKLLFLLKELMESGQFPRVPVHTDSPMAIEAVKIFLQHTEEFSEETRELIARHGSPLNWPGFNFATTAAESKKINNSRYPTIIVSSSGMATGGRILHHLAQRLPDPKSLVLFVGFQAPGTRGFAIKNGAKAVKIYGQEIPVRAQVAALEQFSDHADAPEMLQWLRTLRRGPRHTFLVHGEPASSAALRDTISQELTWDVQVAKWMQRVELA